MGAGHTIQSTVGYKVCSAPSLPSMHMVMVSLLPQKSYQAPSSFQSPLPRHVWLLSTPSQGSRYSHQGACNNGAFSQVAPLGFHNELNSCRWLLGRPLGTCMAGGIGRRGRDADSTEVPLFSEKGCIWNANVSQNHTVLTLLENANSSIGKTGRKTETPLTGQGHAHRFTDTAADRVRPLKPEWGLGGVSSLYHLSLIFKVFSVCRPLYYSAFSPRFF